MAIACWCCPVGQEKIFYCEAWKATGEERSPSALFGCFGLRLDGQQQNTLPSPSNGTMSNQVDEQDGEKPRSQSSAIATCADSLMNLSLLDPPRWGWPAVGAVTDLLVPHEVRCDWMGMSTADASY